MLSTDTSAPLVVVTGATGAQGGSVITNLLASSKPYRFRGITRDTKKEVSTALAAKGVEMVACSLTVDNKEGIKKAFEGASLIFGVTNYWEHMSKDREIAEGQTLIDAAATIPSLKLFVWSGVENVAIGSGGKYPGVLHFDSKAIVSEYGRASGIPFSVVQPGFYSSNLLKGMAPRKQADGTFTVTLPIHSRTLIHVIDTEHDYGLFVRAAIESDKFGPGSEVLACAEEIEVGKMLEVLSNFTGKTIKFVEVSREQFESFLPGPDFVKIEFSEMMLWFQDYGYFNGKSIDPSLAELARPARSWEEFVKASDWTTVLA